MRLGLTSLIAIVSGVLAFSWPLGAQSCPTCAGQAQFVCSDGGQPQCQADGTWACSIGNPCSVPPPPASCSGGGSVVCQASGWACSSGTMCVAPPPQGDIEGCQFGVECGTGGWQCTPNPYEDGDPCPVILDTTGHGFHMTDVAHGVKFAFYPGQPPVQISWTDAASGNGFLVLDRNGDGLINDGTELFGNITSQPPSTTPNGYLALAVFDDPANGGNGNGFIDPGDAVYDKLRVWIDANHNGISEPGELHTLKELGIERISIKYRPARYVDQFGNQFRYRSRVWDEDAVQERASYDVFLQAGTAGEERER